MEIKGVVSVLLFIFLKCRLGSAFDCYACSGNCTKYTIKPCAANEQCMTLEMYSQDGNLLDRRLDCLNSIYCGNGGNSMMVQKCCNNNLCNDPRAVSVTPAKPTVVANSSGDSRLQCYSCGFMCTDMTSITCKAEEVCVRKSTTAVSIPMHKYGCGNATDCDKETPDTIMGTRVSVLNHCCRTNLCNSAVHLEVPAVALLAAIVAAWISKL